MENVLVLNGSPKGNQGNTAKLVNKFIQGLKESIPHLAVENVQLHNQNINHCCGCFSCWTKTPGECIYNDDMTQLLPQLINADLVIWATPLYHYGMTSIMKKFIERTLPVNEPNIVENNNVYTHPQRYNFDNRKNILISNCGFPEKHNFSVLLEEFKKITGNRIDETILCVMGELLSEEQLESRISWYLDSVYRAGEEFAKNNAFSEKTKAKLNKPLVPIENFVEMANAHWEVERHNSQNSNNSFQPGYNFLKLMKNSFNPNNHHQLNAKLSFKFSDLNEEHYFIIQDNTCQLKKGTTDDFTAKIITSFEIWQQISNGELDGAQALMDGSYQVEGDINLIQKLDTLFGSQNNEHDPQPSIKKKEDGSHSTLNGYKSMSLSFIPWACSWIFIESNFLGGVILPLLIGLGLIIVKRNKYEITYFEKANPLYFSILAIIGSFNYQLLKPISFNLNYFAIATIWAISVLFNQALTSDYSKHNYEEDLEDNPIFIRTNNILTLFWASLFALLGAGAIVLQYYGYFKFFPLFSLLMIPALKFTHYFF